MASVSSSTMTATLARPLTTIGLATDHITDDEPRHNTDHLDRVAYLFGHPISHSLSPLFHQAIYDSFSLKWSQLFHESLSIPPFLEAMHAPKFIGASVTMPHKVAIIPYLDKLTPEGAAIGAINTVFLEETDEGRRLLVGTNTDCIGIREGIRQNISKEQYTTLKGRPACIIGGGGTSRAAVYALVHWLECKPVYFINRDADEVATVIAECNAAGFGENLVPVTSAAHAQSLAKPAVIVSAIPDFPPKTDAEKEVRGMIKAMMDGDSGVLLEMCYHPSSNTAVSRIATESKWQVVPGTEAMIWQGFEQAKYWTGKEVADMPVEKVKSVIHALLAERQGH